MRDNFNRQSRQDGHYRNRLGFGSSTRNCLPCREESRKPKRFLLSGRAKLLNRSRINPATGKSAGGLTGHCKTARKAAVAVLRGDGGTFPSQAHMSDPSGVQERAEGAINSRVILQVMPLLRAWPDSVPFDNRTVIVLTNLVHSGLGEYLPIRTLLLPSCIKGK